MRIKRLLDDTEVLAGGEVFDDRGKWHFTKILFSLH